MKKLLSLLLVMLLVATSAILPQAVLAEEYGEDVDIDVGDGTTDPEDTPEEFSFANEPNENGVLGGYITETSTTVTAVAYEYSDFLGWFDKNGGLITTEVTVSKSENGYYGARFNTQNLIADGGFESFTTGSKIYDHAVTTKQPWSFHSGSTTGLLTAWGDLYADGAYKLSGKNSLKIRPPFQMATTDVTLQPNTEYFVNFNFAYTTQAETTFISKIQYGIFYPNSVTNTMDAISLYSTNYTLPEGKIQGKWNSDGFTFTTASEIPNGTVFGIGFSVESSDPAATVTIKNATMLYVDDIAVIPTDNNVRLTVNAKNNATVVPQKGSNAYGIKGRPYYFSVITEPGLTPTVKVGGSTLTPDANGVYNFTPTADSEIKISCGSADTGRPDLGKDYLGRDLTKYNPEVYLEEVWNGDTVYHETAMFTDTKDTVKLLYPVSEVISLRSYSLDTTYIKGVDFDITADGLIKILDGSRIPVYSAPLTATSGSYPLISNSSSYLVSINDQTYPQFAVAVTYKHNKTFNDGFKPAAPELQTKALDNVIAKLKNGEQVNIVVMGDSISSGWCASGMFNEKIYNASNSPTGFATGYTMGTAPYMPTWANMVITELKKQYPGQINFINLSLSGKTAQWGAQNIAARLELFRDEQNNKLIPDLLMTGFGVNDSAANVGTSSYKDYMKAIVTNARNASGNANLEVLYYSPMLPNQLTSTWHQTKLLSYEEALAEIAAEDANIGLVKLTSIFAEMVKCKAPEDYLNTNINHGNDFAARIYATGILAAMFGETTAAPELVSKTHNTVTLKEVSGYEYSLDGVTWQKSAVFTNLNAETTYNFVCRTAETEKAFAGEVSAALTVTTDKLPDTGNVPGNVNGDPEGLVTLDDVVALAQVVAGWQGVQHNPDRLDTNGDGHVTLDDVVLLAQFVAGWDVELSKGPSGSDLDFDMSDQY